MAKANIYPTKYELTEVLSSITNRTFLNSFAQERGIFITNVDALTLAKEVANLFLDNEDLEIIRKEAYHNNSNHALSGFVVRSGDKNFNLKNTYEYIFDQGKQQSDRQSLTQLTKIKGTDSYKGSIEYTKKKAGRIEFLQDETSQFDFYIRELEPGTWQVEVDGSKSTDSRELKEILNQVITKETEIITLDLNLLTTDLSVLFFDRLANEGMSDVWQFKTVTHLTIKRGLIDDPNDDDIESAAAEDLVGITQAILQGANLRENLFVKQSVKSGYRFNAMTYEFAHKKEPYFIEIKSEFKSRPKVFEITIANYEEVVGTTPTREKVNVPDGHSKSIRSAFWNNSKIIFEQIVRQK